MSYLSEIYDFLSEGILGIDDNDRIRYANPAAQKLLNLSPEQLIDRKIEDIFSAVPVNGSSSDGKIGILYGGASLAFNRLQPETGGWPGTAVKPLRLPGENTVTGIMSFTGTPSSGPDERYMLDAVLANIPCQVFIKDARDGFRYKVANKNFTDYYRRSREEVVDRNDYEIFDQVVADQLRRHDTEVCTNPGKIFRFDEDISFQRTGNEVFKSLKINFETADHHPYLLGVCVDVTDFHTIERQLSAALEEVKRAAQAKSYFFATMSHELRTPLNAVIGLSELLLSAPFSQEELTDYLQSIHVSGNALLDLLNDILMLVQSETDRLPLHPEKMDLENFVRDLCSVFRYRAAQKGLTVKLECPPELPYFLLDQHYLRQILLNLLGNAVKFTSEGGVTVNIVSKPVDSSHADLSISVIDTGCGISREFLKDIFTPFAREGETVSSKRGATGAGLGLPVVKRLVDRAGAHLAVDSIDGKGSTFLLEIDSVDTLPREGSETNRESFNG